MTWNGYPPPSRDEDDMEPEDIDELISDGSDGDLPWEGPKTGREPDTWKWPEEDCGPEYKFWRRLLDDDED